MQLILCYDPSRSTKSTVERLTQAAQRLRSMQE
jgi:hypothetical protein